MNKNKKEIELQGFLKYSKEKELKKRIKKNIKKNGFWCEKTKKVLREISINDETNLANLNNFEIEIIEKFISKNIKDNLESLYFIMNYLDEIEISNTDSKKLLYFK